MLIQIYIKTNSNKNKIALFICDGEAKATMGAASGSSVRYYSRK